MPRRMYIDHNHRDLHSSSLHNLIIDVLKFDNSYSLIRSKEVFYSVKVMPPESELSETTPLETEATPNQTGNLAASCLTATSIGDGRT